MYIIGLLYSIFFITFIISMATTVGIPFELWLIMAGPLFLVIISISYIFYENIKRAIIFGVLGCNINGIYSIIMFWMASNFTGPSSYPHAFISSINVVSWNLCCIIIILLIYKIKPSSKEEALIKRTILDLGTKFTRLDVKEIAEKCKVDKGTIVEVMKKMIENQEIYAEYFQSSKSVSFNQQANIDEIDKLMEAYKEWETEKVGKK